MKLKNQILGVAVLAILASTSAVKAQVTLTASSNAPTVGASDAFYLPGDISNANSLNPASSSSTNIPAYSGDDNNYIAGNRPSKGETFTTGSNAGGYSFDSLTVQMATPSYSGVYNVANADTNLLLQIGSISGTLTNGTTLTPIFTATNVTFTSPSIGFGSGAGLGMYLTYDLSGQNLSLNANTQYYFELTSLSGNTYYPLNSTSAGYTGGQVFLTDTKGGLSANVDGVFANGGGYAFDAALVAVPEPGTYALTIMGLLGVVVMIRRRRLSA